MRIECIEAKIIPQGGTDLAIEVKFPDYAVLVESLDDAELMLLRHAIMAVS